jgi:hypothetical protein
VHGPANGHHDAPPQAICERQTKYRILVLRLLSLSSSLLTAEPDTPVQPHEDYGDIMNPRR